MPHDTKALALARYRAACDLATAQYRAALAAITVADRARLDRIKAITAQLSRHAALTPDDAALPVNVERRLVLESELSALTNGAPE